ncbi:hypothetical protein Mapa_003912 [Marchantia paleacea]|nr:hypothetical protein Mapa_003912 [Marchantia paleacea]
MQPSLVTPVERPLRRVSSVRSALEAQQVASNADCFSVLTDRGDNKLEKPSVPYIPGLLPQIARGGEMGSISESDYGNESNGLGGHRRSFSGEQGVRKNRTIVSYCLGGILSLFLLVQIVTGGLGLLSNPNALCGVKQVQAAFVMEKNQIMEEQMNQVGHWKPVTVPVKEEADSEPWALISNKLQETQQSLKDNTVRQTPSVYTTDDRHTFSYNEQPREERQIFVNEQVRDERERERDRQPSDLTVRPVESTREVQSDNRDEDRGAIDSRNVQSLESRRDVQRDTVVDDRTSLDRPSVESTVVQAQVQPVAERTTTGLVQMGVKKEEDSWFRRPTYNYEQCIAEGSGHRRPSEATEGYLLTFANGGLNQMRTAICDMVAVARVMNATLVIPELDHTSYWADPSEFGDVFDVEKFIRILRDDIRIVTELPAGMQELPVYEMAPRSWSETAYYEETVLPLLKKHKVIRFVLTDSRLANNRLPEEIQRLRCKANYKALKFEPSIEDLGHKIISRLRSKGPYIAMHLRFEKDMLAFSGCTFGLSAAEAEELRIIRYNVSRWKEKEIDPVSRRAEGGCPLTPHEIGLMLRAMGYPRKTLIYVAAGQIYGGEARMKTFTQLFPNVVTKETITTPEEMQRFSEYQNRLAAIDYMVAVDSDVFVPSYDGNMARAVQGHRRFNGHKTTLIPDRVGLVKLLDQYHNGEIDWSQLQKAVLRTHRNRQGSPHPRKPLSPSRAKLEENFFANPLPGCICEVGTTTQ